MAKFSWVLNGLESACKFLVEEQIRVHFLPYMVIIQVRFSSEKKKNLQWSAKNVHQLQLDFKSRAQI